MSLNNSPNCFANNKAAGKRPPLSSFFDKSDSFFSFCDSLALPRLMVLAAFHLIIVFALVSPCKPAAVGNVKPHGDNDNGEHCQHEYLRELAADESHCAVDLVNDEQRHKHQRHNYAKMRQYFFHKSSSIYPYVDYIRYFPFF